MQLPVFRIPTVEDIIEYRPDRFWPTKADARLRLFFQMSREKRDAFFHCQPSELEALGIDVSGLREYQVSNQLIGKRGGDHWHRVRQEIFTMTRGRMRWVLQDLNGGKTVTTLACGDSLQIPAFILHSNVVMTNVADFTITTNTTFDPDDERTHDTYDLEEWEALKQLVPEPQA